MYAQSVGPSLLSCEITKAQLSKAAFSSLGHTQTRTCPRLSGLCKKPREEFPMALPGNHGPLLGETNYKPKEWMSDLVRPAGLASLCPANEWILLSAAASRLPAGQTLCSERRPPITPARSDWPADQGLSSPVWWSGWMSGSKLAPVCERFSCFVWISGHGSSAGGLYRRDNNKYIVYFFVFF